MKSISSLLFTAGLIISAGYSHATTKVTVCQSNSACSDSALKSHVISVAQGESADVIVLDILNGKSFHYEVAVIDAGGLEFPGMYTVGARKVSTLPDEVTIAAAEFIGFSTDPLGNTLDDASTKLSVVNGRPVYMLSDVWDGPQSLPELSQSIYQINSAISSKLQRAAELRKVDVQVSLSAALQAAMSKVITGSISASVAVTQSSSNQMTVYFKGNNYLTVAVKLTYNGANGVSAEVKALSVIDNGVVVFEIPVENGIANLEAVFGKTFAYNGSNQSSMSNWLAGLNLGLSWNSRRGTVTITDINDPDIGEVEDQ
ncbi:hypothetical protein [Alteromonas stellipolaris]|uniref:hypothetical protein n=1 Tax=Alteromonas stellipolaris TaxID=233316 RepID=UPI002733717D|nr:hypothetical protein [Alteromonas stellipolaris]MDP2535294.1 hypothetical protein [Alteromonas stellipolaris]